MSKLQYPKSSRAGDGASQPADLEAVGWGCHLWLARPGELRGQGELRMRLLLKDLGLRLLPKVGMPEK